MKFTITLQDGYSRQSDRAKFIQLFPDSMIATALNDSEAKIIPISHPCVTRDILNLLHKIIASKSIPKNIRIEEFNQASRYLLIPILEVIGDPLYGIFQVIHPEINLLKVNSSDYDEILEYGINTNWMSIVKYVLDKCDMESMPQHFINVVLLNRVALVELFIKRGIYCINCSVQMYSCYPNAS